ncbi:MAG: response regulator transcription factor [Clostridia bacterium]|nr:response regulator transcription factor [Clostridia bacterium]
MRILICDDEQKFVDDLKFHIERYMQTHLINAEITTTVSPEEILKGDAVYDLAFLDIQMPGVDGITLGKELKGRNSKLILFYVTAYSDYLDEAMDLQIFRYFYKPFDEKRLYAGLDRAMEYLNESYVDIIVEGGRESVRIPVDDILFVRRENRKTSVITVNGEYACKASFDEIISKLPNTFFYLVHKSFLVNVHHITKYSYTEIHVGKTRISVATRRQAEFHKFWFDYVKRR